MDQDFSKKIKDKKKRRIAVFVLAILIIAGLLASTKIEGVNMAVKKITGKNKVTIEIRCDELSENMSLLKKPELEDYIPKDGVILKETEYSVDGKTTVFDILDKACKENNIQVEYSYTPIYESYYVEGINYLYEFDAGKRSGWNYFVNGESPDYGASKYTLEGGEKIVWWYTVDYTKGSMKTSESK